MADYVEDYIEQLKLATQNRDNFIADFTHELKTPLTSVTVMRICSVLMKWSLNNAENVPTLSTKRAVGLRRFRLIC